MWRKTLHTYKTEIATVTILITYFNLKGMESKHWLKIAVFIIKFAFSRSLTSQFEEKRLKCLFWYKIGFKTSFQTQIHLKHIWQRCTFLHLMHSKRIQLTTKICSNNNINCVYFTLDLIYLTLLLLFIL